jgi:hypothetical protein
MLSENEGFSPPWCDMANFRCSLLETQYCLIFTIIAKLGLGQGCQCSGFSPASRVKLHHLLQKCSFFLIKLAAFWPAAARI